MQEDFDFITGQMLAVRASLHAASQNATSALDVHHSARLYLELLITAMFGDAVPGPVLDGIAAIDRRLLGGDRTGLPAALH